MIGFKKMAQVLGMSRVNAEKEKLGEIACTYEVSRLTISRWTN
jgi:hypothetical protein